MILVDPGRRADNKRMAKSASKRTITPADREAAKRLKRIWEHKKKALHLTQEKAADQLGFKTQAAVSHYLNCRIALGPVATLKFARLLDVSPQDIRPDFEFVLLPGEIPQDVAELAIELASLDDFTRQDAVRFLRNTLQHGYIDFLKRMKQREAQEKATNS